MAAGEPKIVMAAEGYYPTLAYEEKKKRKAGDVAWCERKVQKRSHLKNDDIDENYGTTNSCLHGITIDDNAAGEFISMQKRGVAIIKHVKDCTLGEFLTVVPTKDNKLEFVTMKQAARACCYPEHVYNGPGHADGESYTALPGFLDPDQMREKTRIAYKGVHKAEAPHVNEQDGTLHPIAQVIETQTRPVAYTRVLFLPQLF